MRGGVHLKQDGTPDLRYKENGGGQQNRIYPDTDSYGYNPYGYNQYGSAYGLPMMGVTPYSNNYNPQQYGGGYAMPYGANFMPGMYGGNYSSPIREDGKPDLRFAVNRPF